MRIYLKTEKILGVAITADPEDKILEFITKSLDENDKKILIVTPNPEILMFANHHTYFKQIINTAQVALPDGNGVVWAAKLLGKGITRHITGVDLMDKLCEKLSKRTETVGFLGGKRGVAEKTAECLRKKYPGLKVGFVGEEWPFSPTLPHVDVLFVAFGFPKQEEWIYKNLPHIPVRTAMGVGGAFDYISGKVPRAPKFFQDLGLEWAYRLVRQPWRWRRQLALLEFSCLIIKEFLGQGYKKVSSS